MSFDDGHYSSIFKEAYVQTYKVQILRPQKAAVTLTTE